MKNFCSAKTLVNGEINSKLEENICKPQATKNLSKIFKELLTFKNKQTYNLIKKKRDKYLNGHFTKEDVQMANKLMKTYTTLYVIKEFEIQTIISTTSLVAQMVKRLSMMWETRVRSLG